MTEFSKFFEKNVNFESIFENFVMVNEVNVIVTSSTIDIFFEITKFSKILSKLTRGVILAFHAHTLRPLKSFGKANENGPFQAEN